MATINLATIYMLYVCHLIANNWFAIPKSRNPCKTLTTRIPEEGILHHAVPDCFHLWSSRCSKVDLSCCVNIHESSCDFQLFYGYRSVQVLQPGNQTLEPNQCFRFTRLIPTSKFLLPTDSVNSTFTRT